MSAKKIEILSLTEMKILLFVTHGFNTVEIAKAMKLSGRSVELYCLSIRNKLKVQTNFEIVAKAISIGLVAYTPEKFVGIKKKLE